jgi:hypothetical protein
MFLCYQESMARQEKMITRKRGRPATGVGELIGVRVQPPELSALDTWIKRQEARLTRPEAIRRALRDWLAGLGLLKHRQDRSNLDQHIERLEGEVAHLKPAASGKPSPAKGMAMLRRGQAKSDLAKAKNKRAKDAPR